VPDVQPFAQRVGAMAFGEAKALVHFKTRPFLTTYKTTSTRVLNDRLLSVSCTTPRFCMASNFDARSWRLTKEMDGEPRNGPKSLIAVSCAASRFCMAVTTTGESTTFRGWELVTAQAHPRLQECRAYSASCVSASECSVIGLSGAVTTWDVGTMVKSFGQSFLEGFVAEMHNFMRHRKQLVWP